MINDFFSEQGPEKVVVNIDHVDPSDDRLYVDEGGSSDNNSTVTLISTDSEDDPMIRLVDSLDPIIDSIVTMVRAISDRKLLKLARRVSETKELRFINPDSIVEAMIFSLLHSDSLHRLISRASSDAELRLVKKAHELLTNVLDDPRTHHIDHQIRGFYLTLNRYAEFQPLADSLSSVTSISTMMAELDRLDQERGFDELLTDEAEETEEGEEARFYDRYRWWLVGGMVGLVGVGVVRVLRRRC